MQKTSNPWTFDVRVRERDLKSGALTEKDVEKYLTQLPDLAEHSEAFATSQPALDENDVDDIDDEEDEADEPVAAPASPDANG